MRHNIAVLSVVCLFTFVNFAIAQEPSIKKKGVEIKGTVVNFAGIPSENASIKVVSKEMISNEGKIESRKEIEKETLTNSKGEYSVTNLPEGSYEISLEPTNGSGILRQTVITPIVFDGRSFEVDFGLEIGSINDCPRHTIYGVTKDERGKDVKGAKISVVNAFNQRKVLSSKTDEKGVYQIDLCNPGQYIIFVNTPNYEVQVFSLTFPVGVSSKSVNFVLKLLLLNK